MSAHDEREALYRDVVAGRALDATRVATVARLIGISATTLLVDLRAEAWGIGYFEREPQARAVPGGFAFTTSTVDPPVAVKPMGTAATLVGIPMFDHAPA